MGVRIYYYMVIAVLAFGLIMPQQGRRKKHYIVLMAVLHAFVCGFRYMYLTGDLRKYAWSYYQSVNQNWNSEEIIQGGRNVGFSLLNKLFAGMTHGDFQIFLVFNFLYVFALCFPYTKVNGCTPSAIGLVDYTYSVRVFCLVFLEN